MVTRFSPQGFPAGIAPPDAQDLSTGTGSVSAMQTTTPGSALGTLLLFLGTACHRFDRLETGELERIVPLFPAWRMFLQKALAPTDSLAPLNSLDQLENALLQVLNDPAARRQANLDFNVLFQNPHQEVPLWESVWVSDEKVLFTADTTDVRQWYRRFGVEIAGNGTEAEDHIGLELAFAGYLFERATQGHIPLDMVEVFAAQHLNRWAEPCLEQLERSARTPLWSSLLAITRTVANLLG